MKKTILLFLISASCFGQLSPKVNELYQELSKSNQYESKNIGIDGHESEPYKIHTEIGKIATDQELEFIALHGNVVAKTYISNILISRKSKVLEEIFKRYLETNDSIKIRSGCVGYQSFLADEMYKGIVFEREKIKRARYYKKLKNKFLHSKKRLNSFDLDIIESLKIETQWKPKEIDSLQYKLDQIVLDNKESSENIVNLMCSYYLDTKIKIPYYKKMIYFEEKYNSEYIKDYLKFCRYGILKK
ncbi:hypothetical protein [Chryseobacterium sp. Mn2064]|uniref:hypothetical protein n=1 Tax=Chryseobacterium sp. Mn2064 TaxID=3395263 RepID=UPI003BC478B4